MFFYGQLPCFLYHRESCRRSYIQSTSNQSKTIIFTSSKQQKTSLLLNSDKLEFVNISVKWIDDDERNIIEIEKNRFREKAKETPSSYFLF